MKRKAVYLVLLAIIVLLTQASTSLAATVYFDRSNSYNPVVWTKVGVRTLPYEHYLHEAVSKGTTSQNVFYHESYTVFNRNLWGGAEGFSWTVMVINQYFTDGGTEKLFIGSWNPKSLYLNTWEKSTGGWNSTDVSFPVNTGYVLVSTTPVGEGITTYRTTTLKVYF